MLRRLFICVLAFSVVPAYAALDDIPEEKGLSGFFLMGAGVMKLENNMIAGNKLISFDNERVDSLFAPPDSETSVIPAGSWSFVYTFEGGRTQIQAGNRLEDFLRFDLSVTVGIRQKIGRSILGVDGIRTPALGVEVWEDPYITGVDRVETDRETTGVRVTWDRIAGSGLEVQLALRDFDIDDERSGSDPGLGLTPADRALLDRNGDLRQFQIAYRFKIGQGRHYLEPMILFEDFDLDGAAMAYDGYDARLTYGFLSPKAVVIAQVGVRSYEHDEANPIYGVVDEQSWVNASVNVFFDLFKSPSRKAFVTAGWADMDADIDFYSSSMTTASIGAVYRFK